MPLFLHSDEDWDADTLIGILSEYADTDPTDTPYLVVDGVKVIL